MNKRIHKNDFTLIGRLADIAHEETVVAYNERLKVELASDVIFYDMFNQRLGELVVAECLTQAKSVGDLSGATDDMIYGADIAAVQISKHFGVE